MIYEHDPDPEFCDDPDNRKTHVHHDGGDPTCSAHGMMHQPKAGKAWECLEQKCSVKHQPKKPG